jgi:predicted phage terminase large subunit-like protein
VTYPLILPPDLPDDFDTELYRLLSSKDPLAKQLGAIRWAESSFEGFIRFMYPKRTFAPFQLDFIRLLDKLEKRTLIHPVTEKPVYNLLTNFPPRHAKTHYGTINFAAYLMGRNTKRKVMVSAYNATLAQDFGGETKAIALTPEFRKIFPKFQMSADKKASDEWKTTDRGAYYAIGLDGTTSGRPANALIIDDPIKNRSEADSAATRKFVWDQITSAFWSRLEPEEDGLQPIQIMTLTRWHPDDPAGRLAKLPEWGEGEWMHVYYQGLTELPPDPHTPGIKQYKALWPERFPVSYLLRQKSRSERDFAALYQQQPLVEGGNMVKSHWWQWLPKDFRVSKTYYHSILIAADTAFKERTVNDYSALAIGGITAKGDIHVLGMVRARLPFPELKAKLISLNALWRPRNLRAIVVEDKASGQSLVQELRNESGLSIIARNWPGDKVVHLASVLPLIEGGRVFLPHKDSDDPDLDVSWIGDFLTEIEQFPSGAFDDQVDALSLLLHELARTSITPEMLIDQFNRFTPLVPGKGIEGVYGKSIAGQLGLTPAKQWGE